MVSDSAFAQLKKEVAANKLGVGVGYGLQRTGAGTVLQIKPFTSSASNHPFKAITSVPYTGTGTPPANWGLKFQVKAGIIIGPDSNTKFASNKTAIFTATDNCSDGYYLWAKMSFATNEAGDVTFTDFEYGSGATLPDAEEVNTTTGAPPSNVYLPLFYVTTQDSKIDGVNQLVKNSIQVRLEVGDISAITKVRNLTFQAI